MYVYVYCLLDFAHLLFEDVLDQLLPDVEDGLDQGGLAGDDDDVLVRVVRGRPDA